MIAENIVISILKQDVNNALFYEIKVDQLNFQSLASIIKAVVKQDHKFIESLLASKTFIHSIV